MEKYNLGLNQSQCNAVECENNKLLLIAGAGSGKSMTLVRKVEWLLFNRIDSNSIYIISFTRAAANELKSRLNSRVKSKAQMLNISTFHTFVIQMLRKYSNYDCSYFISNQEKDFLIELISKRYSISNTLLRKELKKSVVVKNKKIQSAINDYLFELNKFSLTDIEIILPLFLNLLETNSEFLNSIKCDIDWLFYDEAQDMSELQYRIITMLITPNDLTKGLVFIGDDNQNIYRWNGTSNEYLLRFKESYSADVLILPENYRSTSNIVNAANNIISYGENLFNKSLTAFKDGADISFLEFDTEKEELMRIVGITTSYINSNSSISIICRTNSEVQKISKTFKLLNIDHRCSIKPKLNEDVLSLLSLCINLDNELLLKKFINYDKSLNLKAIENDCSLLDILIESNNADIRLYKQAYDFVKYNTASESFDYISKLFNINDNQIKNAILKFEETSTINNLNEFLIYLNTKSAQDTLIENNNNISIMTIHASKGLEFDTVILYNFTTQNYSSKEVELEENRCLVYVAITRAKSSLIIMNPRKQQVSYLNKEIPVEVSTFKKELTLKNN